MGLQTVYRKPRTTIKDPKNYKYPYLLKDLKIERPGQLSDRYHLHPHAARFYVNERDNGRLQ